MKALQLNVKCIKFWPKNYEYDGVFRSLLAQTPFKSYNENDNVQDFRRQFVTDVNTSNETAYQVVSKRKKVLNIFEPFVSPVLNALNKN